MVIDGDHTNCCEHCEMFRINKSAWCTLETNITWYVNYTSITKKLKKKFSQRLHPHDLSTSQSAHLQILSFLEIKSSAYEFGLVRGTQTFSLWITLYPESHFGDIFPHLLYHLLSISNSLSLFLLSPKLLFIT